MKVTITLVPGVEEKIRQLAHAMTLESIDTDSPSPPGQLLELLLPDLLDNALAGDMLPEDLQVPSTDPADEPPLDIKAAVEQATAKVTDVNIAHSELEVKVVEVEDKHKELPRLTMLDLDGQVNSKAYNWASGNPAKEKALIDTCMGMPRNMWNWEKLQQLAERTYQMQSTGKEDV